MTSALSSQLALIGMPSRADLDSIDAKRHPSVAEWVNWSYEERATAVTLRWLAGYRRFGNQFEAAARLAPLDPASRLEDMWMLAGLHRNDFTYPTRKLIGKWQENSRFGAHNLSLFVQMFVKLGNVPDDFHDLVHWAGDRYILPMYRWTTWANGVLGKYAEGWTSDDIRSLISAGVKRRQLDEALADLYGVKAIETRSIYTQVMGTVPFEAVHAVLLGGVSIEYARELL